jgi:hypothetical protein
MTDFGKRTIQAGTEIVIQGVDDKISISCEDDPKVLDFIEQWEQIREFKSEIVDPEYPPAKGIIIAMEAKLEAAYLSLPMRVKIRSRRV